MSAERSGRHVLTDWRPEDTGFWQATGKAVATRNLWISVPNLTLAFAIWMVWSMVVAKLKLIGFKFTTEQLFWLTALPALSGATLRIFYSFLVPILGGRLWTLVSTLSLLIPAIGIGIAVQNPQTPYWMFVALALACGLGGGNFASSMSNISFFYPKAEKGNALAVNAGFGNLGVSLMQFLVPVVITLGAFAPVVGAPQIAIEKGVESQIWLQNAGFVWVPFIVAAAVAAWVGMNDIASAKASFAAQAVVFKRTHNWVMCYLYLGTFGSFIGYAAGFPLLIKSQFPNVNPLAYAWLGPLVGAVIRPFGGWLADKLGGARVTLWNFIVMAIAVVGVTVFLPSGSNEGQFGGFFVCFLVLFLTTGIGNGSTFRMIPVIFLTEAMRGVDKNNAAAVAQANKEGNTLGAATLGFTAAMAAYGGFFIPKSYGSSIALTGAPHAALWCFAAFYLVCIAVTWWYYARKHAEMPC